MKRYSIPLAIRDMQIKASMIGHHTPIRIVKRKFKNFITASAGKDVEQLDLQKNS